LRIFVRIVVIGALAIPLTLIVWRGTNGGPTIGECAWQLLHSNVRANGTLLEGIGTMAAVDFLVSFGFLFGIWFLWGQGRNAARESGLAMHRSRLLAVSLVATVCALPPAYYALWLKEKFHSGLADTPSEVMEYFVLISMASAIVLCGVPVVGRFWPRSQKLKQ